MNKARNGPRGGPDDFATASQSALLRRGILLAGLAALPAKAAEFTLK